MFFLHKKFASWRRFSIWSVFVKCVFEPLHWYGKDREIHKHIPAILEPPKRSHTCDVKKPCYSCDVYIYFPYQLVIYIAGIVPSTVFRPKFLHHPFKRFYKGGWRFFFFKLKSWPRSKAILVSEQVFFVIPFLRGGPLNPLDPYGTLWKASAVFGATVVRTGWKNPGGGLKATLNETDKKKS